MGSVLEKILWYNTRHYPPYALSNKHLFSYLKEIDEDRVRKTNNADLSQIETSKEKKKLCEDRMESIQQKV